MKTPSTNQEPSPALGVAQGSDRAPLSPEALAFHSELWEWLWNPLTPKHMLLGAKKAELCEKYGHGALAELEVYFQCNPNTQGLTRPNENL
jgi:hypothetical protein